MVEDDDDEQLAQMMNLQYMNEDREQFQRDNHQ